MNWRLGLWFYGVPTIGMALTILILWLGAPDGSPLRFLSLLFVVAWAFLMWKVQQVKLSVDGLKMPKPSELAVYILMCLVGLSLATLFKWKPERMIGMATFTAFLSWLPLSIRTGKSDI